MKKWFLIFAAQLIAIALCKAQSTNSLSISDCYKLAEQNYPLVKRYDLIKKTADYSLENLQKGYLPQFAVSAQASYQSAVTSIPIRLPGVEIPVLSKDQYKAYAEVDQVLYDGGEIARQKDLQKSNETVSQQQLASDLYQLKDRINQLFFGVLLIDEQLKQNDLLAKDLQLGLDKTQASVKNGTAFRSNADLISAELLQTKQQAIELQASRKAYTDMLSLFIGKPVDEDAALAIPQQVTVSNEIKRPELAVFDAEGKGLDVQNQLLTVNTLPKLSLFLQGGYGRPGLDALDNNFAGYYLGGIHLSWSPSVFYTLKKKRAQIDINRQELAVQKETFLFNTNLTVKQQSSEISKYQRLSASDDEIIALREKVKTAAMAQLENGVITGNDFLKEVNDEDQAKQNKLLHSIQLLMAQYNQQTTTGNQP
jgi:outer membrane protein TolC